MRDPIILLVHLIATLARLMGPGGLRSVVAESVLVKQQLLILNRSRHRAPNLCASDRTERAGPAPPSDAASGKSGSGKMHKIRSDIYFLLLTKAEHKLVLLTEQDMYAQWKKEVEKGRVPSSVKFVRVEIPEHLNLELRASRQSASREVTPE